VIIVTYWDRLESVWRLGYWLEDSGIVVRFPAGQTCFTLLPKSIAALGPILPYVQWVPWTLSPRMERPRREAHYSHLSSAEVKFECCYTFTPTYAVMVYAWTAFHTLYRYYLGVIWLKYWNILELCSNTLCCGILENLNRPTANLSLKKLCVTQRRLWGRHKEPWKWKGVCMFFVKLMIIITLHVY
jgi:hypothetical protein